jgi:hypothetical protein
MAMTPDGGYPMRPVSLFLGLLTLCIPLSSAERFEFSYQGTASMQVTGSLSGLRISLTKEGRLRLEARFAGSAGEWARVYDEPAAPGAIEKL